MLDETWWMTRRNDINFHPTFLQHLSNISFNILDKMLDRFIWALMIVLIWQLQSVSIIVSDKAYTCILMCVWVFFISVCDCRSDSLFITVRAVIFDLPYCLCSKALDISYLYSGNYDWHDIRISFIQIVTFGFPSW